MRALFFVIAVLAGCAELPEFDTTCGNGVIDLDEDCDNTSGTCVQCSVTCADDAGCAELPGKYTCGADFVCHAPSGVFVQSAKPSFPFIVGQGAVADIDGDRIGDVVGFSDITIDVRFGDLDAGLTTRSATLLPYTNAAIAMRELDPITRQNDILVPTPDGIAAYTANGKQLVSFPFSTSPAGGTGDCLSMGDTYDPVLTFELDKRKLAFVSRHKQTGKALLGVLDVVTTACVTESLCDLTVPLPMEFPASVNYDHYETQTTPLSSVIAIGVVAGAMADTQQVCVMRFSGVVGNFSLTSLNQTPTTPINALRNPIAFARALPAAVCPALFLPNGTGIEMYTAAGTANSCTIALAPTAMPGFMPGDSASGHIPLVPPIAGRAPDALVAITGVGFLAASDVYALVGTTRYPMYHSSRALYPVRAGDLDGDGRIEAVASVPGQGPGGQPDLDILYRTAAPVDAFVPYRITTQGVPTHISLGDYDGNTLTDIAYTERIGSSELLMIAYGTRDRPLPAVPITAFDSVVTLARIDVPDSIEPSGQVLDDLLVASFAYGAMEPTLTVLHGNPQRSMLAYYDPRGLVTMTTSRFITAVTGNFDPATPAADVLAFEVNDVGAVKAWVIRGNDGSQQLGAATSFTTSIGASVCPDLAPLCLNGTQFLPWSIGDRAVAIAADAQGRPGRTLVTIDPMSGSVQRAPDLAGLLMPLQFVFSLWPADLAGTNVMHLLVSVGTIAGFGGESKDNKVLDCTVGAQGNVTACSSLVDQIEGLAGWTCQSAAPARVSARGRHDSSPDTTDVLLLCKNLASQEGNIYRLERAGAGYRVERVLAGAFAIEFLSLGDINGDQLDDLATISFDPTGTPIVDVHLQCDARDIKCREAGSK